MAPCQTLFLAVASDGHVWAWGTHHKGLLGNLRNKTLRLERPKGGVDALLPYRIGSRFADMPSVSCRYLKGVHVTQALSCHIHNFLVDMEGKLYAWGCGSNGRTGLQQYLTGLHGSRSRMKCYIMQPSLVEKLSSDGDTKKDADCNKEWNVQASTLHTPLVEDISSWRWHSAAICSFEAPVSSIKTHGCS